MSAVRRKSGTFVPFATRFWQYCRDLEQPSP
jgi:hypothetical protein